MRRKSVKGQKKMVELRYIIKAKYVKLSKKEKVFTNIT